MELWNGQGRKLLPPSAEKSSGIGGISGILRIFRGLPPRLGAVGLGALFASACTSGDICPFGVAYCAAAGHPASAALGAFCRYVLSGGQRGLIYAAACAVVLTCRLVLEGTATGKRRWFFPLCAMIALFSTGLVLVDSLTALLSLAVQTLLCGGFARMLREARDARSPLKSWGRLTAMLAAVLAWLPISIPGGLSPARMLAALLLLSVSCCAGGLCGGLLGAAYGAAMDVAMGHSPFFALLWCVSASVAGVLGRRERLSAALSFSITEGLLCLWLYQRPCAGAAFYEGLLAGAVLTLLPRRLWLRVETGCAALTLEPPVRHGMGEGSAQALRGLSAAMCRLGQLMEPVPVRTTDEPEELGQIFRRGCELSCRSCPRIMQCWQQDYAPMREVLCHLRQPLERNHAISPADLPPWFAGSCLAPMRFCGSINDAYRDALRLRARQMQEQSLCAAMGQQYQHMSALLESAAVRAGAGRNYDPRLEGQIRRIVRAYLPGVRVTVCLIGGQLQLDLLLKQPEPEALAECEILRKSLQSALRVQLLPPERVDSARGTVVRLRQQERCVLHLCSAAAKKDGELVSGDAFRHLHTGDGRAVVLLSDGMGTGQMAGMRAEQALELLCSFVRSGCALSESVATVLPVLAARFPEWGFVTLDLLEVNLFSGKCSLLKYGAAPGFLLRQGKLTRFDSGALPAGLAPEGQGKPIPLRLSPGDRVILLSDGAFLEEETSALLREHGTMEGQALAELLLNAAEKNGSCDDMTVLVAELGEGGTTPSAMKD